MCFSLSTFLILYFGIIMALNTGMYYNKQTQFYCTTKRTLRTKLYCIGALFHTKIILLSIICIFKIIYKVIIIQISIFKYYRLYIPLFNRNGCSPILNMAKRTQPYTLSIVLVLISKAEESVSYLNLPAV